ncbi:hypothetical protein D3C77_275380 [compost metagenome]
MIVYDVHNDAQSSLMQSLNGLFKLGNPQAGNVRIRSIGTFWNVVVLGIISPIVLWLIELRLVDAFGGVIVNRQELNMRHA